MATPGSSLDFSLPPPMETPTSRFRRGPTIGYHSAGLRDSRERNGSTGSKFLVIVVPPHSVTQEHGNLGHTLSSGPAHRLSQGLIMPLFPTMYGQLTAIAREFNFPSSAGICLYYCYSEHGITMTPRLSDDIWPTIWGINEPSERRSPIVGKLEFDLDMAQARWYTAWLSSRHRESTENALPQGPTTAPSLQFRGDNRFSFPPTASEDGTVDHHSPQQRSAPVITRHVPRKLSLVDRFDTHHVANTETRRPRASASPPSGLPLSSHILSPITQQEEPKSARNTLDERVKSWRQSAVVNSPIELESSGAEIVVTQSPEQSPGSQSSFHLEDYAFSISSAGPDDSTSIASYHQDYLPSVHLCDRVNGSVCMTASYRTSAGPPSDYEFYYEPSEDDARLPSPDIAWRMFEEAPPTPRTATSWGPPSPGSLALSFDAYSPSLDLAHRAYFSCPSTPGTATSWGAPSFDGAYSVASQRSAFSIHLCDRGEYSRPPTPRTATSWGPPSCDFEAPSPYRLPSPDAAHRTFEDAAEWEMRASMLDAWRRALAEDVEEEEMEENVAEESSVSAAAPWAHSWPYRKAGVSLKTVATAVSAFSASKARAGSDEDRVSSEAEPLSRNAVASVSTAEVQSKPAQEATPWAHSWPYRKAGVSLKTVAKAVSAFSTPASRVARAEQAPLSKPAPSEEDAVKPWAHSWPYRKPASLKTVAKAVSGFALQKVSKEKKKSSTSRTSSSVSSPSEYPFFVLYPPVYPHFDLYPPVAGTSSSHNDSKSHLSPVEMSSNSGYPSFVLYPPVYPYFDLYPSIKYEGDEAPVSQRKTAPINMSPYSGYPSFVLYPPVYPYFDLYPAIKYERNETSVSRRTTAPISMSPNSGYPSFVLYPPVYPYFDLYPAMKYERNETSISQRKPIDMSPNAGYPSFVIYAPVYPYFALYPPVQGETPVVQQKALMAASCAGYPSFVLYPAGYPHNLTEIYPGVALSDRRPQKAQEPSVSTVENPLSVFASYPSLCIYFPSYPHNVSNIYPTVQREAIVKEASLPQPCRVELNEYPSLIIYSPVYPYNLESIYPIKATVSKQVRHTESVQRPRAAYPYFDLYPAVYPHFNLYPGPSCQGPPASSHSVKCTSKGVSSSYPSLVIYPSQYPHFDLYPPPAASMGPLKADSARSAISTRVAPGYPYFNLSFTNLRPTSSSYGCVS
ncbi:hypothetical protein EST38_g1165 [Candolleomyces aberdarensis]|uniref:Uncharacterized protein n=1 Tax=Candolleomyces aberdarensis TaxID=2316362 RepID=A0A4Q2DVQ0_9AGAR|nr:hypothetical protein EST38_g1165 [Candolleomyces aberdarensis]